ncbi:VOC family protein [Syntrophomonas curvata]
MVYRCPLIVVENMETSRKFYEEILNQKVILDFGANITFAGDYSLQTKASWADFIDKRENEILTQSNNFELYFEEDNFDDFIARLQLHPIRYVHDVKEYSWGQRVIRFYDPDLNIIEVGESMCSVVKKFIAQGLSIEETSEITQHPIGFVKSCLGKE